MPRASPRDVAPNVCCGRPLISQGVCSARRGGRPRPTCMRSTTPPMRGQRDRVRGAELPVGGARGRAGSAARRAAAARPRGRAAVGAVRGVPRTRMRAPAAPRLQLKAGPANILLAPALSSAIDGPGGAGQGAAVARCPAATVIDLDAGCCGMAGSFGYTRDHYDVSRAIGERKLLPAARALDARLGAGRRRHLLPPPGARSRRRRRRCIRPCCCDRCYSRRRR